MLDKLIHRRKFFLITNYVFWLLVIIISASQLYLRFKGQYDGGWFNFFWRQSIAWVGWALLTPLIVRVIEFFHAKIHKRQQQILFHSISAVLFTLAYVFILSVLSVLFFDSDVPLLNFIKSNIFSATATNLLVYALIAVFGYTLVFYKQTKTDEALKHELDLKNEALQKEVLSFKLNALKMQIQPHFLFNSLHSVSSLIRKESYGQAIDTISLLSELLRNTINNQEADFVKLRDEIELTRKYLSIEKIRFDENLIITYDIDEDTLDALVPSFILQPLIENTFKHGFRNTQKGEITISSKLNVRSLVLTVNDNGEGLQDGFSLTTHAGIGLSNIEKRLQNLFDDQASLTILPTDDKGVEAIIQLPHKSQ